MDMMSLLMPLVGGAAGGNIAGLLLKKVSMGTAGNSVVGLLGGLAGPYLPLIGSLGALGGPMVGQLASGGAGGGVLVVIIGLIRSLMSK
jgi:hypothetical protein